MEILDFYAQNWKEVSSSIFTFVSFFLPFKFIHEFK